MIDMQLQSKYSVRIATNDDIPELLRMRLKLQHHMESANARILKHSVDWKNSLSKFYEDLINDPDSLALLVINKENQQAVGMSIGQLIEDKHFEIKRFVKINDVWVYEEYRKKGICSLMINEILRLFKERGITTFTLNYVIKNLEAEQTWHALGFEPIIESCVMTID